MGDYTMPFAYVLAKRIGPPPAWTATVDDCVRIVEATEANAIRRMVGTYTDQQTWLDDVIRVFTDWSADPASLPGVASPDERMNVLLRLWSGCISAGKMIALGTRSGSTSVETRANSFADIDAKAKECPI